jgi:hypothetical protein
MKTHDRKRFLRLLGDLAFMRRGMFSEFKDVNAKRFSEERAKIVRKKMDKDLAIVKCIDALAKALSELLGHAPYKPEKVPKVTVRKVTA